MTVYRRHRSAPAMCVHSAALVAVLTSSASSAVAQCDMRRGTLYVSRPPPFLLLTRPATLVVEVARSGLAVPMVPDVQVEAGQARGGAGSLVGGSDSAVRKW